MKDRLPELFLEDEDLTADRGLRHMQLLAGAGERTGLSDRANDFQLPQVHIKGGSPWLVSIHARPA